MNKEVEQLNSKTNDELCALITRLNSQLLESRFKMAVGEVDILRVLHLDTFAVTDDGHLVKKDVMNRLTFESLDLYRLFGTNTRDITEGDIRPVGEESFLVIAVGSADSGTLVCIAR